MILRGATNKTSLSLVYGVEAMAPAKVINVSRQIKERWDQTLMQTSQKAITSRKFQQRSSNSVILVWEK